MVILKNTVFIFIIIYNFKSYFIFFAGVGIVYFYFFAIIYVCVQ